jgi:hypothetical protein
VGVIGYLLCALLGFAIGFFCYAKEVDHLTQENERLKKQLNDFQPPPFLAIDTHALEEAQKK